MKLGIWSKNVVSRVLTKIKKKLGKVDLRKGANLRLLLQPPEEFLGPLNGLALDSQVRMVRKSQLDSQSKWTSLGISF